MKKKQDNVEISDEEYKSSLKEEYLKFGAFVRENGIKTLKVAKNGQKKQ